MRIIQRIYRWLNVRRSRWLIVVYALLLAASQISQIFFQPTPFDGVPRGAERIGLETPRFSGAGELPGDSVHVSILRWTPESPDPAKTPIVLVHGSPGSATTFTRLAPLLASEGRLVYSIDLPGFGESTSGVPDYSIRAHARYTLAALDQLGLSRVHLLGFSMGGGVILNMNELAPDRIASLAMVSAIGAQEAEGSGSYYFEHAKYAAGCLALVVFPEVFPHFGMLGPRQFRHAWLRNFWDTDQRPLRHMLETLTTPMLILHGRADPLVPAWGAELHHQLAQPSSLVVFDASHFLVFLGDQPREVAEHLNPFLARHDRQGVPALRYTADYDPAELFARRSIDLGPFEVLQATPWWLLFILIVAATWISEDATVIAVGVLIAHAQIDWGVGLLSCFVGIVAGDGGLWAIGRFAGRRAKKWPIIRAWAPTSSLDRWGRWFDQHTIQAVFVARAIPGLRVPTYFAAGLLSKRTHGFLFWAGVAAFLWTPMLLMLAIFLGPRLLSVFEAYLGGPLGVILSIVVILLGVRLLSGMFTWVGRRKLSRDMARLTRIEFWPKWAFYAPLIPWAIVQSFRRGGPMTFTCLNPDIPHGGGIVGESKYDILQGMLPQAEDSIVRTHLIEAGHDAETRTDRVDELVRTDPALGGYPVVLKPDESQMGHAFKVARSRKDVHDYFLSMTRAALLQQFHPGPCEVGVLWVRNLRGADLDTTGRIFSITRKEFPSIVGNGRSTLDRIVWKHPRYRMQAEVFLKRFDNMTDRVLAKGERMNLGVAGNHAQGARFLDASELITPALEKRINEIALSFSCQPRDGQTIGGFDYGRFDLRYTCDEDLKRGVGFALVELNGAMSESTNLYDPRKSILWTYRILYRQWEVMYRLGHARRRLGVRPMRPAELLKVVRDHFKGRPGPTVSD